MAGVRPFGFALARQPRRCSGACGLSCGLSPFGRLTPLFRLTALSSPALASARLRHLWRLAICLAARRAHPLARGVGAPLFAYRASRDCARLVPAGGVRTVPWLAPRPRACLCALWARYATVGRRCAPFGAPARAVRPLRVRALSALRAYGNAIASRLALRAPFARVLRAIALRPPALSGTPALHTRGFGRAGRPLSGLRLRLPLKGGRPRVPFAPLARPFGALRLHSPLAFAFSVWRGVWRGVWLGAWQGCRTALRA